jgi:hypothetical protein
MDNYYAERKVVMSNKRALTSRRTISLKQTAYHEAGHAVMAVWLRCRCLHVSIIPDENEGTLGHLLRGKLARVEPEPLEPSAKTRLQLERLVLVYLAGNAAEYLLTGRKCFASSNSDFMDAYDYLNYLTRNEEEIRAYIGWLRERAKTILSLNFNWFAVETLANELLKEKYLGRRKVYKLIRKAWYDSCPLPEEEK